MFKNDKQYNSNAQRSIGQYRIGMSDLTLDSLWNPETEKYKVLCRMIHVTKATLYISYIQMIINFVFLIYFTYYYMMDITGYFPSESFAHYKSIYIFNSQLLLAFSLQLILVLVVIHGVRTEKRSLLLPYIIYTTVAILAGCAQLINDFVNLDYHLKNSKIPNIAYDSNRIYAISQFLRQLFGTMIYSWCLSIVWRCYIYLGDKKVASRIAEQLSAFEYPEDSQLIGYVPLQNQLPPPYVDTVLTPPNAASFVPDNQVSHKSIVFLEMAPEKEISKNQS